MPQPKPGPVVRSDDGKPDMVADLAESPEVLAAVQDDDFAQALYAAICNQDWRKGASGRWTGTWRQAGDIVANLRGKGEMYADWYCSGIGSGVPEGTVPEDVRHLLDRIGWQPMDEHEIELDHEAAAVRVRGLERLPAGEMPD